MKQEELENDDFGSDVWLRQNVQFKTEDSPEKLLREHNKAENKSDGKALIGIKEEGDLNFGSDSWLRLNFESGDEEMDKKPIKPVMIKIKKENNERKTVITEKEDVAKASIVEKEEKTLDDKEPTTKRACSSNPKNERKARKKKQMDTTKNESNLLGLSNVSVSESAATGLCSFKCPDCTLIFTSLGKFVLHLRRKHQTKVKYSDYSKFLVKTTIHNCRICFKNVLCECALLNGHIKSHKLTLFEYREKYNCGINKETSSTIRNVTVSKYAETRLCTFKCSECPVKYKGWLSMCSHLKSKHNIRASMNGCAKYLTKAAVHVCKICSEKVYCDYVFLENHFRCKHKFNLKTYIQQHNKSKERRGGKEGFGYSRRRG